MIKQASASLVIPAGIDAGEHTGGGAHQLEHRNAQALAKRPRTRPLRSKRADPLAAPDLEAGRRQPDVVAQPLPQRRHVRDDADPIGLCQPVAGTGLTAAGGHSDKEDSDLTIARLRAEGDIELDGGSKLSSRAAVMARSATSSPFPRSPPRLAFHSRGTASHVPTFPANSPTTRCAARCSTRIGCGSFPPR